MKFYITLLFLMLFSLPLFAQEESENFTLWDIAKLRMVGSAVMSPDGNHVAYNVAVPRRPFVDKDGSSWAPLYVTDIKGNSRPFITGDVRIGGIQWTPDSKHISFLTKRGDDKQTSLYVIPVNGGEARKIFEHETSMGSYSWSPDGSQFAFVAGKKSPQEKNDLNDKGFSQEIYEEEDQPSYVWIASPQSYDNMGWGEAAKPAKMLELPGSASSVNWSPDGKNIAVVLAPSSRVDDFYMASKLHIVSVETGKSVLEYAINAKLGQHAWSPDGQHMAIIAGENINDPSDGRLFLGSLKDSKVKDLLPGYLGNVNEVAWQGNENLMYLGSKGVYSEFAKIKIDGSGYKAIIEDKQYHLAGFSMAQDGMSAAFVIDTATHPREIYYMKHGDEGPQRLTDNNSWLAKKKFAPQEVVTYKARDGLMVDGLLMRPLNAEKDKRYPLVMIVHGGPEAHYSHGWLNAYSTPGQVLASQGFAVFYPNYRGSTGRGVEFSKMGQSDYGGKEFDDLIDGIDHLVNVGLVDKNRVGVTGGSYGGFASAWCATYHSERFAASVMFVGISDQISKFGTTDIPNEMYLVHSRKWPWEDWNFFRERSPITYVEKARTPILIMHGKEDTRVHPSQSMELYRYLKTYGKVPVRLVLYPGEGHGNRRASSRLDYSMRLVRWMEHYLKGNDKQKPPHALDYSVFQEKKPEEKKTEEKSSK